MPRSPHGAFSSFKYALKTAGSQRMVAWWHNARASDLRSRGRGFDLLSGRNCKTTLGKLISPVCVEADNLRYYMESWGLSVIMKRTRLYSFNCSGDILRGTKFQNGSCDLDHALINRVPLLEGNRPAGRGESSSHTDTVL